MVQPNRMWFKNKIIGKIISNVESHNVPFLKTILKTIKLFNKSAEDRDIFLVGVDIRNTFKSVQAQK